MICFQISIFEPLNTAIHDLQCPHGALWFAFKLVSLSHWIQLFVMVMENKCVVICFQISIFEPLNTASFKSVLCIDMLWFAFKLVSLSHWIQPNLFGEYLYLVVICFQISIFEPLNTASFSQLQRCNSLWFAFKLVSLSHWIQRNTGNRRSTNSCDLLSN